MKLILLLVVCVLVVGCSEMTDYIKEKQELPTVNELEEEGVVSDTVKKETEKKVEQEVVVEPELSNECSVSEDCTDYKKCINGVCSTVSELYDTGCDEKCNFNSVEISSSIGDSYTLSRGQGSYTAAGAVEWKLVSGPDYCPGDKVIIPIELIKKATGKIISKEILTISPGETTQTITHPNMKSVSFSLTVDSVNEVCG